MTFDGVAANEMGQSLVKQHPQLINGDPELGGKQAWQHLQDNII